MTPPRPLPDRFVMTPARRAAVAEMTPRPRPYVVPPRPLPDLDQPWVHPGWGNPNGPDLFWPTVAVIGASVATATWVGFTAARSLLRRLP